MGKNGSKVRSELQGDGGKVVDPHVSVGNKKVFIGPHTVLRWPE
jgi:hypothetical protein